MTPGCTTSVSSIRGAAGPSATAARFGKPTTAAATGDNKSRASAARCGSVCFLNAETGWAAGGLSHPYLHSSSGVVLATRDGGRHWHRDPRLMLPALRQIRFFDAKRGWAAGNSSPMFPAGVFSPATADELGRPCVAAAATAG